MIDAERLGQIKERAVKASEGPWRLGHYRGFGEEHDIDGPDGRALSGERGMFHRKADAGFVAHARDDVPWLVEALEGTLAELEDLRHDFFALSGNRRGNAEPEKTAEEQAKLEEAVADLRAALARLREETGMTEGQLADYFDLNEPFPEDHPSGREAPPSALDGVVARDPNVARGEPVFAGTEVPVRDLIEHLKGGEALIDFTAHSYTAVTREQTAAFLEWALVSVEEAFSGEEP